MTERIDVRAAEPLAGDSEGVAPASDRQTDVWTSSEDPSKKLWRGAEDGPMPMRPLMFRPPVPDLRRIEESRWREVLGALPKSPRIDAALTPGLGRPSEALDLALSLPPAPSELALAALTEGPTLPMPELQKLSPSRQVNVRLQPDELESLRVAGKLLGLTPTQVARMCILTGVRRAIADHDAALTRIALAHPRNEPPAASSDGEGGPATAPAAFSRATSSDE